MFIETGLAKAEGKSISLSGLPGLTWKESFLLHSYGADS